MQTEIELQGVSKEDLYSWLNESITKLYMTSIHTLCKDIILEIGGGGTLDTRSMESTALNTAMLVGYCNALKACLKVELEDSGEQTDA